MVNVQVVSERMRVIVVDKKSHSILERVIVFL